MNILTQLWNVIFDLFAWAWNWSIPDINIRPIPLTLTIIIIEVSLEAVIPILYKSASSAVEKGENDD